jgi:acetate---CoA ligase (ADP-forming)
MTQPLEPLFAPRAVAVVGASSSPASIGGQVFRFLRRHGQARPVYPVNPGHEEIDGSRCYPTVDAIPDAAIDLAVIAVAADRVPAVVEDCGRRGVRFAIVLSAGFEEAGAQGKANAARLTKAAHDAGVRLIGPNCQGLMSLPGRLRAGFGGVFDLPIFREGDVSIVSQSGGLGYPITHILGRADIGLRHIVSTGNENDLGALDILEHYVGDPGTRVIATYLEGVDDIERFDRVARSADAAGKPLIVWKVGRSERGARAAAAHTDSVVGDDAAYRATFARRNAISVREIADLVDFIKVLDAPAHPKGRRVGMLTVSGGAGILFADACADAGLVLPDLEQATVEHLRELAPPFASMLNPVDVTAQVFNRPELLSDCLEQLCADPNTDSIVLFVASMMGPMAIGMARTVASQASLTTKPIYVVWTASPAEASEAHERLTEL